jgi:hypothetical protein
MLRKIAVLTSIIALTFQSLSAQERDFRKERAELARQEREQKRQMHQQPVADYGTNILSLAPFAVLDIGVGVGMSYEKIFGADQNLGLILPVYILFDDFENDPYYSNNNSGSYFYFAPGLKVYPFGQRKTTYAIGPNLFVGGGTGKETQYDMFGNMYTQDISKFRLGILINNYLNFQFTKNFNLGLQGGLGVRYIDRETYNGYTDSRGMAVTGQFSITLGYRF